MSDEKDTLGGLLGSIMVGLGATLFLAMLAGGEQPHRTPLPITGTPAGSPPDESPPETMPLVCTRVGEVGLNELSLAQIGETLRGQRVPPDNLVMSHYAEGETITCWHCGGTYHINGLNTQLVTYEVHPQYTHLSTSCPGPECRDGYFTVYYDDYRLIQYLTAGYPGILAGYEVSATIRKIFRGEQTTVVRRVEDATEAQQTAYAAILAQASGQKLVASLEDLLADNPPQG